MVNYIANLHARRGYSELLVREVRMGLNDTKPTATEVDSDGRVTYRLMHQVGYTDLVTHELSWCEGSDIADVLLADAGGKQFPAVRDEHLHRLDRFESMFHFLPLAGEAGNFTLITPSTVVPDTFTEESGKAARVEALRILDLGPEGDYSYYGAQLPFELAVPLDSLPVAFFNGRRTQWGVEPGRSWWSDEFFAAFDGLDMAFEPVPLSTIPL